MLSTSMDQHLKVDAIHLPKREETTLHGLSVVFSDLFTLRKKGRKKGNNRRYITELCKGHQDLLWRRSVALRMF
jgi:hypothetical protein